MKESHYTFYFEKLEVWQNARILVKDIYTFTEKFPIEEKYGITSQIRRAVISISSNISGGLSRKTNKEKARFIEIAYSSSWELINLIILAVDLEYLKEKEYVEIRKKIEHITNQLNALHKKLSEKTVSQLNNFTRHVIK